MQPRSVTQKQVPRCIPSSEPNTGTHRMLSCLGLPPLSPRGEQGAVDPSDSCILPMGQELSIFKPWDHLPPPILMTHAWRPGTSCSNAVYSTLHSALQLWISLPPYSHQGEVPALHPQPLTILSPPPARVQTFPLPLSSTVMRVQATPGPAGQGAFLLSCTVYYSKRGIWLGEEMGGQPARREAGLAGRCSPAPTLSPTCPWGGWPRSPGGSGACSHAPHQPLLTSALRPAGPGAEHRGTVNV